jgi:hypothetical protein
MPWYSTLEIVSASIAVAIQVILMVATVINGDYYA